MSKFVSKEPVGVTVEGDPNTVYIKPKMDYGLSEQATTMAQAILPAGASIVEDLHMVSWDLILMELNIIRWEGPDFEGAAVTREAVRELDRDDPLVKQVVAEIKKRNYPDPEEGSSPNSSTPKSRSGSTRKQGART